MLRKRVGVDLGTANTLIYVRGQGVVLNEPSVVALDVSDGKPVAVGHEAKRMMGRTPGHIRAVRPLKDGVIADFDVCEKMLRYFIQKVHSSRWSKPRMVIDSSSISQEGSAEIRERLEAMGVDLLCDQVALCDFDLFVLGIPFQPDDLHTVEQRLRQVQRVRRRHKHDVGQIDIHFQIMVLELAVLFRVQHLE